MSIEQHPNYRVVQVSDHSGDVGMLLPHANLVVPDKHTIRNLRDIIQIYEKLKPSKHFNYGTPSNYQKRVWQHYTPTVPKINKEPSVYDLPLLRNSSLILLLEHGLKTMP